jgi:hypothetical protein
MRKTILTTAALLGIAPAALAATGPLPGPRPAPDPGPAATESTQVDAAKAHRATRTAAPAHHKRKRAKRPATAAAPASPQLEAIAQCESGGNPAAVGGGGQFRGKYQFTYDTWAAIGGSGDPASAPEAEQDRRAAQLLASSGAGQWPNCG